MPKSCSQVHWFVEKGPRTTGFERNVMLLVIRQGADIRWPVLGKTLVTSQLIELRKKLKASF
jgi:hypothetical protein